MYVRRRHAAKRVKHTDAVLSANSTCDARHDHDEAVVVVVAAAVQLSVANATGRMNVE